MNTAGKKKPDVLSSNFIRYNAWADEQVIDIVSDLPLEVYQNDLGYTIGNIHIKSSHLVSIMEFFKLVLEDQTPSKFPDLTGSGLSREELLAGWKDLGHCFLQEIREHPV